MFFLLGEVKDAPKGVGFALHFLAVARSNLALCIPSSTVLLELVSKIACSGVYGLATAVANP